MLWRYQSRQHRPHGRNLNGVWRDMFAPYPLGIEVLLINLNFVLKPSDIRNIDLNCAISQSFHELVVLQAAVLRLIGVAEDDLVDVRLRELFRLDLVLL